MKKFLLGTAIFIFNLLIFNPSQAMAYNFGDFRSETLVTKAWGSFKKNDIEGVLAYTNKCLELYAKEAQKMQNGLSGYPKGKNEEIFKYWALNDVATSLFIQGEMYRKSNMEDEAKKVFEKLVNEYAYGQAWDPSGWFWKPAEGAKEKLAMMGSGDVLDFGDYTSSFIVGQAWKMLDKDPNIALKYVDKVCELYQEKAQEMQNSLTEYPWQSREQIFNYWALNDVGTALFIKGEAFRKLAKNDDAKGAYKELVDKYYYSQCWDPQGWFWKPAEAAQEKLDELSAM